jgi:hypothetical protein
LAHAHREIVSKLNLTALSEKPVDRRPTVWGPLVIAVAPSPSALRAAIGSRLINGGAAFVDPLAFAALMPSI